MGAVEVGERQVCREGQEPSLLGEPFPRPSTAAPMALWGCCHRQLSCPLASVTWKPS